MIFNLSYLNFDNAQNWEIFCQTRVEHNHCSIRIVKNKKPTNCMHCNRGILTVGFKIKTVEIVGIIFPHPQPPKPTVVHNTTSNKVGLCRMNMSIN